MRVVAVCGAQSKRLLRCRRYNLQTTSIRSLTTTWFFGQKFGKEGTTERIKAEEDVLSSCSGQILLNARKEAKWLWQSQLPHIRISYPCKNVSTLQSQPANHWKSEQKWLKGLKIKPFKPFSRDFPWFWLTVFSVNSWFRFTVFWERWPLPESVDLWGVFSWFGLTVFSVNSCFRFTRLFLIWVDRFSVKFRFRFTVFRDGVSRWMVRRWMVQKVHGGYIGKDEGSKSRGFIEQFGTWGFQSLRLDFQSLGLWFQSLGLRSPAAAWGSCLVGPAELRRGTAGKMELEILRQRTVGRGIAGAGKNGQPKQEKTARWHRCQFDWKGCSDLKGQPLWEVVNILRKR